MSDKNTLNEEENNVDENLQDQAVEEQEEQATEEEAPAEEQWEVKYSEVNDKYLRLYSEFENFRRRTAKERLELINTASSGLMKELLPILDDFDRAISSNEQAAELDVTAVQEGFSLIYQKLVRILQAKGLKEMEAVGKAFDAELHEAIAKIPAPDKKQKGKIVDVVEKGYMLNDSILRYGKVVVGE